ncbi:MAG: hypothetical protein QQN44_01775 [Nitrosopumilus sp.]
MKEIQELLVRIFDQTMQLQSMNVPQRVKDDSRQILINSIDMVNEAFSPQTIYKLIRNEDNRKAMELGMVDG